MRLSGSGKHVKFAEKKNTLIKYEADCLSPALCLEHITGFDENDILVLDEPNEGGVCHNGPGGWINGGIAYKALCEYW